MTYWQKNNWKVDIVGAGYFSSVFSTSEQFVQSALLLDTACMFFHVWNERQVCHLGFSWVAESWIPHICPLLSWWREQQLYIIFIDFSKYSPVVPNTLAAQVFLPCYFNVIKVDVLSIEMLSEQHGN